MLRRSLADSRKEESPCISDAGCESPDGETQHKRQLQQLQGELAQALERNQEAETYCSQLQDELRAVRVDAELQQFRAVEREREKWEEREQRWLAQLNRLESRLQVIETTGLRSCLQSSSRSVERPPTPIAHDSIHMSVDTAKGKSKESSGSSKTTTSPTSGQAVVCAPKLSDGTRSDSAHSVSVQPQAHAQHMVQQTPPLSKFT